MLKYLDKVKLASETAGNGQECIDMVFSKEPGYYSLIIVRPCPPPIFPPFLLPRAMTDPHLCVKVWHPDAY